MLSQMIMLCRIELFVCTFCLGCGIDLAQPPSFFANCFAIPRMHTQANALNLFTAVLWTLHALRPSMPGVCKCRALPIGRPGQGGVQACRHGPKMLVLRCACKAIGSSLKLMLKLALQSPATIKLKYKLPLIAGLVTQAVVKVARQPAAWIGRELSWPDVLNVGGT